MTTHSEIVSRLTQMTLEKDKVFHQGLEGLFTTISKEKRLLEWRSGDFQCCVASQWTPSLFYCGYIDKISSQLL